MRFVNLSQPYGNADLFMDAGQNALITLAPLSETPWRDIAAGEHTAKVTKEGVPANDPAALLAPIEVVPPQRYTIALYGPDDAPVLSANLDDTSNIAPGSMRYVFRHVAVGLGPIDVINQADGAILAEGLTYGAPAVTVDLPLAALSVSVASDGEGPADLGYAPLPEITNANIEIPVWFTYDGTDLALVAYSPGAELIVEPPTNLAPPTTTDTSDTGP
jgi:hypothetical protein